MRATAVPVMAASLAWGVSAAAQGYGGYQGYPGHSGYHAARPAPTYAAPSFAKPPSPPASPKLQTPPRFKPFKGQHLYSNRGGLDPYPAPARPKGGFSTYGN